MILEAQIHAREVMPAEVALDAIEQLTGGSGVDPDLTRWLDHLAIWIVPVANPDGARYMFGKDPGWRTNRRPHCPVDLNRNFATCVSSNFATCVSNIAQQHKETGARYRSPQTWEHPPPPGVNISEPRLAYSRPLLRTMRGGLRHGPVSFHLLCLLFLK